MGTTAKPGRPRLRTLFSSLLLLLLGAKGRSLGWETGSPQGFSFSSALRGVEVILITAGSSSNLKPLTQLRDTLAVSCRPEPGWKGILTFYPSRGSGNKLRGHNLTNVHPVRCPCRETRQNASTRRNPRRTLSFRDTAAGADRRLPQRGRGRRIPANVGSRTERPSRRHVQYNARLSETVGLHEGRGRMPREQYNSLTDREKQFEDYRQHRRERERYFGRLNAARRRRESQERRQRNKARRANTE